MAVFSIIKALLKHHEIFYLDKTQKAVKIDNKWIVIRQFAVVMGQTPFRFHFRIKTISICIVLLMIELKMLALLYR